MIETPYCTSFLAVKLGDKTDIVWDIMVDAGLVRPDVSVEYRSFVKADVLRYNLPYFVAKGRPDCQMTIRVAGVDLDPPAGCTIQFAKYNAYHLKKLNDNELTTKEDFVFFLYLAKVRDHASKQNVLDKVEFRFVDPRRISNEHGGTVMKGAPTSRPMMSRTRTVIKNAAVLAWLTTWLSDPANFRRLED